MLKKLTFNQSKLNYEFDSLEPYIDKETMVLHYTKHHALYLNNLNTILLEDSVYNENLFLTKINSIENLLNNIYKIKNDNIKNIIRNNGGGHFNHEFFWNIINNKKHLNIDNLLVVDQIKKSFKSITDFKNLFIQTAINRFGSGWAWLTLLNDKKLIIHSTSNQDNPLMKNINNIEGYPLLGVDIWEHAYYLKYKNRRLDYLNNFWEIINWEKVNKNYINFINES